MRTMTEKSSSAFEVKIECSPPAKILATPVVIDLLRVKRVATGTLVQLVSFLFSRPIDASILAWLP